jgi:hypothetical protein
VCVQARKEKIAPQHIEDLRGSRAIFPRFPQAVAGFMNTLEQMAWKLGIRSLLDLSGWSDPSRDPLSQPYLQKSFEIIEVDELIEGKDPHDLSCTKMVALVGIWLNWHNPGNSPYMT